MEFSLFCSKCHAYIGTELAVCQKCKTERDMFSRPRKPGEIIWQSNVGGAVRGKPVVFENLVIFTWGNRRNHNGITALDRFTGVKVWNYESETTCEAKPVINKSKLYFTTLNYVTGAKTGCLDARTGEEIWQRLLPDSSWSSPVVQENRVFVGTSDGQVFGFSSDHGEPLRNYPLMFEKGRMWLEPINETQFAALSEGGSIQLFTAMQTVGGWRKPIKIPGRISSPPTFYNGSLYFGVSTNEYTKKPVFSDGNLGELNVKNGSFKITAKNLTEVIASPYIDGGTIYIGARDHLLHAIDLNTQKELWSGVAEHSFSVIPEINEGLVIIGSHDGSVYAFDANPEVEQFLPGRSTTLPVWKYTNQNKSRILCSVTSKEGVCNVGFEDGTVIAFPYHLGEYGWAASRMEQSVEKLIQDHKTTAVINQAHINAGNVLALSACFQLPEKQGVLCESAGKHWQLAGEPEWLARLYDGRRELTKAAKAFEDCAEYQRGKNRLKAAEDYFEASIIYTRLMDKDNYSRCLREACLLGGWPLIDLEWKNQSYLQQLEKGEITIRAKNVGYSDAKSVKFKLGGTLMKFLEFEVCEGIPIASWLDLTLEIVPTQLSSDLCIDIEYPNFDRSKIITNQLIKNLCAVEPAQKIKFGASIKGKVKIYNPQNHPIEFEMGNSVFTDVEIHMEEDGSLRTEINGQQIECPSCHNECDVDAIFCPKCQQKIK
jgi:outer membrane protein assembly factor BamB